MSSPKPNNPALWSKSKAAAKKKFKVYPSAYANGHLKIIKAKAVLGVVKITV